MRGGGWVGGCVCGVCGCVCVGVYMVCVVCGGCVVCVVCFFYFKLKLLGGRGANKPLGGAIKASGE